MSTSLVGSCQQSTAKAEVGLVRATVAHHHNRDLGSRAYYPPIVENHMQKNIETRIV